jgi:hypothetical protein
MKYIDGIQPPGAIWGEIVVEDGAFWYEFRGDRFRINPKARQLEVYYERKIYEQKQGHTDSQAGI